MKCKECGTDNPMQADYCRCCGEKFSEEEQKQAYGETIFGKIDHFLEIKDWVTLDKITGNPVFRAFVLMVLIAAVVFNVKSNGSKLAIRDTELYDLSYNTKLEEYYVATDLSEVDLSVYIPKKTTEIRLDITDPSGPVDTKLILPEENITVQKNTDWTYKLTAGYEDGKKETVVFFVCGKEAE